MGSPLLVTIGTISFCLAVILALDTAGLMPDQSPMNREPIKFMPEDGFYPKPNIYICYTCVGATALLLVIWAFTMDIKWEQAEQLRRAKLELAMKKNDEGEVDEERDMTLLESSGGEERKEVEVSDEEQTSADSESEDGDENDPVPSPVQTRSRRLSASRNEIVKPKEDEPAVRRRRTKVLASRNEDPEEDRVSFRTRSSSRTRR